MTLERFILIATLAMGLFLQYVFTYTLGYANGIKYSPKVLEGTCYVAKC